MAKKKTADADAPVWRNLLISEDAVKLIAQAKANGTAMLVCPDTLEEVNVISGGDKGIVVIVKRSGGVEPWTIYPAEDDYTTEATLEEVVSEVLRAHNGNATLYAE